MTTSNCTIDYSTRTELIRGILALPAQFPHRLDYVYAEQTRLLDRVEDTLAGALVERGIAPEAARQSAFSFVRQMVERVRAERQGAA